MKGTDKKTGAGRIMSGRGSVTLPFFQQEPTVLGHYSAPAPALSWERLVRRHFAHVNVHLSVWSAPYLPDFKAPPVFPGDGGTLLGRNPTRWIFDDHPGFLGV